MERSSPASLNTVSYTQAAAVAVAGVVSQAQVSSSAQLLTHTSGHMAHPIMLPYTHALPPQGGPGQLQPSAYLPPAPYNYVQQVSALYIR